MSTTRAILAALTAAALACGVGAADEERRDDRDTAGAGDDRVTVRVWFSRDETPVAVEREVAGEPLPAALRELVQGPTPAEREAGIWSWFSGETADVLRATIVDEGNVVVDFRDLPRLIPNASTSAGSADLLASLDSTVFQFPWVQRVEYRLDGSCDAFWNWLQRGCHVAER